MRKALDRDGKLFFVLFTWSNDVTFRSGMGFFGYPVMWIQTDGNMYTISLSQGGGEGMYILGGGKCG